MKVIQKKSFKKRKFEKIQSLQCFAQVSLMLSIYMMFANISKSSSCSSFQIKALSDEMVIDFSYVYIKALSDGMVIDLLCLHQGPLRWNGH